MSKSAKALSASVSAKTKTTAKVTTPEPGVGIGAKLRGMATPPKAVEPVKVSVQPTPPWEDAPMSSQSVGQVNSILESLEKIGIRPTSSDIPSEMPPVSHTPAFKPSSVIGDFNDHPLLAQRKQTVPIQANTYKAPVQNATFGSSTSPLGTVFANVNSPEKKEVKKPSTAFFSSSSSSII